MRYSLIRRCVIAGLLLWFNKPRRVAHLLSIVVAVMGILKAGGAYLPALSDVILMVEGTSFMGLGGPNLVKGAIGKTGLDQGDLLFGEAEGGEVLGDGKAQGVENLVFFAIQGGRLGVGRHENHEDGKGHQGG